MSSEERSDYRWGSLGDDEVLRDPFEMLREWLAFAVQRGVTEPTGMCLATSTPSGFPSARMVLLRGLDSSGLKFYTNYLSRKGQELSENPRAAVCFWWPSLERQVRVEGQVQRLSSAESDAYFESRPLESRKASIASPQSRVIESRTDLEEAMAAVPDDAVRPEHWGGYRLVPSRFEFWQGRPARLHDRFEFNREGEAWAVQRLAP